MVTFSKISAVNFYAIFVPNILKTGYLFKIACF